MRGRPLWMCLVLVAAACASPRAAGPKFGAFGLDLTAGDGSVRPGDDFDRHANGRWLASFTLKNDQAGFSVFDALIEDSDERLRGIVAELQRRTDLTPGSPEQKIRDFYASFLDQPRRNSAGIGPLRPLLARYAAIQSMTDLIKAFGTADLDAGNAPIGVSVGVDRKDPHRYLATVGVAGLGLPDNSYYLDADPRFAAVRTAYLAHVAQMLAFAEVPDPKQRAAEILQLETALARVLWPPSQRRDPSRTYNVIPYSELATQYPGFEWDVLFAAQGLGPVERVNVSTPSAVGPVLAVIRETPLSTWRVWLTYHAINGNASTLSQELDDASFDFYGKVIEGQPAQRELWRRGIEWTSDRWGLGEELGRLYVARHFTPEARRVLVALVDEVRGALRENLERAEWLGPETRAAALRKLQNLRVELGYPEKWRDSSSLTIVPDDLFANARALRAFRNDDMVRRVNSTPDRGEWRMTPQTPNSYHFGPFNEVVFPAAILQPPLFDPASDAAVNFGAIGAFIGHELGHAFDDQGSKYDDTGALRNWWSDADRARFQAKQRQLAVQVATYCPLPGKCVDPELTMGENLGDLAGLSIAFTAYRNSLRGKPAPVLEGLSGDQRFFLGFAQMWRTVKRDEALLNQLSDDPHPPAKYRINGALRNFDAWYAAFDVRPTDALYLPPEQRVRLW